VPRIVSGGEFYVSYVESSDYTRTTIMTDHSRSEWPRGLRHEPSSLARTLGSWVRIPLEAWMPVYIYSVFVLFCM
jgi:hypothetical protein